MIENQFFWVSIFTMSTIIEWVALKMIMDVFSQIKVSKQKYYIKLSIMIGVEVISNLLNIHPSVKAILLISMTYIFYKTSYRVSWIKALIGIALFWMLSIGSESIVMSIVTKVFNLKNHMDLLEPSYIRLLFIILTKVVLIGIALIYTKLKIAIHNDKKEMLYILLPLITNSLILLFIFAYSPIVGIDTQKYYLVILGITLVIILANISLILLIIKMSNDYVTKLEHKNYQDKMKAEYNYYLQMEAEHQRVMRIYHDINNHIACIKGLVEDDQRLKKYIQTLEKEIPCIKQIFDTGNKVVDTLLRQKSVLCEKENISLKSRIDLRKCMFIEDKDYCSIFGNALDNAIEACQKIEPSKHNRYIKIETEYIKQFLVIKIRNSKDNLVIVKGKQYITQKQDKFLHGLGLKNIKSCVEKYNGEMVVQYTECEFCLKLVIPLNWQETTS